MSEEQDNTPTEEKQEFILSEIPEGYKIFEGRLVKKKYNQTSLKKGHGRKPPEGFMKMAYGKSYNGRWNRKIEKLFLTKLRENHGNQAKTLREIGFVPGTLAAKKVKSPKFAEEIKEVLDSLGEDAKEELHRRSVLGVTEEIYHGGKVVGKKQVYSDSLLLALVKSKDSSFNTNINIDADITTTNTSDARSKLLGLLGESVESIEGECEEVEEDKELPSPTES